jgi:hypothetical protein
MFKHLVSCQGNFANIVTSKLPQLTVLGGRSIMLFSLNQADIMCDFFLKNKNIRILAAKIISGYLN